MHKKVRSEIFHLAATMSTEFQKHLDLVWGFSQKKKRILLDTLPAILQAKTEREQWIARESAVKKLGGDSASSLKAIEVLNYIGTKWHPLRDLPEVALRDFRELGILPKEPEPRKAAVGFLRSYFEFLRRDSARRTDNGFKNMILPSLLGVYTTIDYRAVVESEFDWRQDDPRKYQPRSNRTVPVVLLKFKFDEGEPIIFQCDVDDIQMIIRQLQAILKDETVTRRLVKSRRSQTTKG